MRRQDPLVEVFNMDDCSGRLFTCMMLLLTYVYDFAGRCGEVAIIKEYIDSKTGILELRTTEGGPGDIILFNENQVWLADRFVVSYHILLKFCHDLCVNPSL